MCTVTSMGDWRILGRGDTGAERILLLVAIREAVERLPGISGVGGNTPAFSRVVPTWEIPALHSAAVGMTGWCCGSDEGLVVGLRPG